MVKALYYIKPLNFLNVQCILIEVHLLSIFYLIKTVGLSCVGPHFYPQSI